MRLVRRMRERLGDERGVTLPELLVATVIMGIVMVVFGTTLASVQMGIVRQDNLSRSNDQARLAMQQLDREIRSGNVLYDPAIETVPFYTLRVYTQSNADTRNGFTCVLWQLNDEGEMLTRTWPPNQPGSASDWRVVATGIVNKELGVPAFALDPDPLKGDRTLNVTLRVNEDLENRPTQTIEISESLTGRNTSYGYPASVCSTLPT